MNGFVGMPMYCGSPSVRSPRHLLATMPKSGWSDFAVEVGSAVVGVLPVSNSIDPSLCDDIVWCNERTIASLSAHLANSGNSSQTSIPGTADLIGPNGPRISAGASGFGSNVSNWLGPPHIQNRMTEVSGVGSGVLARAAPNAPGRPSPARPRPARRTVRRLIGPEQSGIGQFQGGGRRVFGEGTLLNTSRQMRK